MKTHIFLTGFMGSGKTTVGKKLAKELALPFLDMDDALVQQFGMSIADVFKKLGETVFRKAETQLIASLSDQQPSVIGTGGGVPVLDKNRYLMRQSGTIIYLNIHIADTKKRMTNDDIKKRPLWKNERDVCALFEQRKDAYADHDFKVDVSNRSPEAIVKTIIQHLM